MRELIIASTIDALRSIEQNRFFKTERGYHGKFYCALQSALDERCVFNDELILEMEYQKSENRYRTGQRPDIILHIPTEVTGAPVTENNLAVWALKYKGSDSKALDDFRKLDLMFENLHYQIGFFINVSSDRHRLNNYAGSFPGRLISFAVKLTNGAVQIRQALIENGRVIETVTDA
jgi:hypothetical protein